MDAEHFKRVLDHHNRSGLKADYHQHIRSAYYVIMLLIMMLLITLIIWFGISQWSMLENINDTITQINNDVLPMVNEYSGIVNDYIPLVNEYVGYVDHYIPIIDDYIQVIDPIMKKVSCTQECGKLKTKYDNIHSDTLSDNDQKVYNSCNQCSVSRMPCGVVCTQKMINEDSVSSNNKERCKDNFLCNLSKPELPSLNRKVPPCSQEVLEQAEVEDLKYSPIIGRDRDCIADNENNYISYNDDMEKMVCSNSTLNFITENITNKEKSCRIVKDCEDGIKNKIDTNENLKNCKPGRLGTKIKYVFTDSDGEITSCTNNSLGIGLNNEQKLASGAVCKYSSS